MITNKRRSTAPHRPIPSNKRFPFFCPLFLEKRWGREGRGEWSLIRGEGKEKRSWGGDMGKERREGHVYARICTVVKGKPCFSSPFLLSFLSLPFLLSLPFFPYPFFPSFSLSSPSPSLPLLWNILLPFSPALSQRKIRAPMSCDHAVMWRH